jgi:hypothetical protein
MFKFHGILIAAFVLTSCAGVDFYNNPALTGSHTGIPFYAPKPYLLVARTGAKDKPIDINVVYLPDLSKTYYAKPKPGFGSAKMNMGFSNGIMTTFGQETDPKITELITSLAGVPSSLATGEKLRAEAKKLLAEAHSIREQASTMPELAAKVRNIAVDLTDLEDDRGYDIALKQTDRELIGKIKKGLESLAQTMDEPGAETKRDELILQLEGFLKQLSGINKASDPLPTGDPQNVWSKFGSIKDSLSEILKEEKPKPRPEPTLTLYEVLFTESGTQLKEVSFIPPAGTGKKQ